MACCRRSKLPNSLEMVLISYNLGFFELEQWLLVLAALSLCHSLGLVDTGGDGVHAFDAMAVRCGLATSPSLRLLVSLHGELPALAAERTARGLPCFAMRSPAFNRLRVIENAPSARFGQCALLPSPQIDAAPSLEAKTCPVDP